MSSKRKIKRKTTHTTHSPDKMVLIFLIAMAIFGAIMIYDASVYMANAEFNNQFKFLTQQIIWIFFGTILGSIFYFIEYRKILKLSTLLLGGTIFLLVLVLVAGVEVNGSRRWFQIGPLPKYNLQSLPNSLL